ncbi:MAG TPA: pentapeptide repeat-containing protein [Rhizomicrobium sp.]|nr:pentapeptide repeat-containing protein [Rhizomicrobium sp.]
MAHEDLWQNEYFREAFQRWWDEDWSWDGLAKRPAKRWLEGVFEENSASVRDAWQAEEAGLIEFGGRMWTRFHLPPFDRSGNLVADWYRLKGQEFSTDVGRRLTSAEGSYAARWKSDGAEPDTYHADLQGVIFPDGFSIPNKQAFADFSSSVFLGRFAYSENLRARFCNAIFAREARFDNSRFAGDALFNGSTFVAACSFEKVHFVRGAEFLDAWFAKTAMFQRALFNDDALFGSAIFEGQVSFAGAEFWGVAQLRGSAPFKARVNFAGANFWKECDFSNRSFDDSAAFTGVRFNGVPRFDQAKLHSDTDFGGSQFRGGEAMPDEWATARVRLKSWRRLSLRCAGYRRYCRCVGPICELSELHETVRPLGTRMHIAICVGLR